MEAKKSPKADLENRKGLYLEIGLVVILAVALLAFNIKSYDREQVEAMERVVLDEVEDTIIQTEEQEKPPESEPQQDQVLTPSPRKSSTVRYQLLSLRKKRKRSKRK